MCPANVPSLPPRLVAGCRRLPVVPGYQQLCDIRERVSDWGVRRRPTVPRPDPPVFDMNHRYGAKSHPNSRDLLHAVRVLRRLADHHAGRQAAGPSAARLTGPRRAHPDARVRCPASSRHRQVGCLHPVRAHPVRRRDNPARVLRDGQFPGDNQYGPNPKGIGGAPMGGYGQPPLGYPQPPVV